MQTIFPLPPHVADLIAAGEVVQRPASAVKELIENALDAGARAITVEVQRGGMRLIRVTDDGCGLSAEDAGTAFLRHATSKIRTEKDLSAIATMGFRGEALASIAAVSRVELLTRKAQELTGVSLSLEGGAVLSRTEAGCPEGMTLLVRDLFFNTPARQKFMKKDSTEAGHVQTAVLRAALARPDVSFRLIMDGRQALQTSGDGDLQNTVYAALGREFAQGLLRVSLPTGEITVTGLVGKPETARATRAQQYFFVCRRPVYSRTMTAALEEAYKAALPSDRCPVCVLFAELPYSQFDCNVHPAKTEVKFAADRAVFDAVYAAVRTALDGDASRPELKLPEQRPASRLGFHHEPLHGVMSPRTDFFQAMGAEQFRSLPIRDGGTSATVLAAMLHNAASPIDTSAGETPEAIPHEAANAGTAIQERQVPSATLPAAASGYRIVGEVLGGYILVEEPDGLLLIDRHAAHERILFDRLKAQERELMSQQLLTPYIAALSPAEAALLLRHTDILEKLGFQAEDFGGGSLRVSAVPDGIDGEEIGALLSEIADSLQKNRRDVTPEVFDELLHTIACKAAIKIGRGGNQMDTEYITHAVMTTPTLKNCPHGRPVAIFLSRGSLERQFGR